MPTIKQLPAATSVNATDVLPISQGGSTKALTVAQLLSSTQAALSLASGKLLGRASSTAGGPEVLGVGPGLQVDAGMVLATGADHASLRLVPGLGSGDEVIVNSNGAPGRMAATALRGLFSAGPGVTILDGAISASATGSYALPVATTSTLGGVKVDGRTIVVDGAGVLSAQVTGFSLPAVFGNSAASLPITSVGASFTLQNGPFAATDLPGTPDSYEGIRSVLVMQPGSSISQAAALGGYALSRAAFVSTATANAGVALYGESVADIDGARSWGMALNVHDGHSTGTGAGRLVANKIDVGVNHPQTQALGLSLNAAFSVRPASADAYVVTTSGDVTDPAAAQWCTGLAVRNGAAVTALRVGTVAGAGLRGSMPVVLETVGTDGVEHQVKIEADPAASLLVTSAGLTLQSNVGQPFASFGPTTGLTLPAAAATGVSASQSLVLVGRDASNSANRFSLSVDSGGKAQTRATGYSWQTSAGQEVLGLGSAGLRLPPASDASGSDSVVFTMTGRTPGGLPASAAIKADANGNAVVSGADVLFQITGAVRVNGTALLGASALPGAGGLLATTGTAGSAQAATLAQFETMLTAWLQSKPTAPAAAPGWWNNAGLPTYS
ncbi:MAG: hypothetical protein ACRYGM_01265 [Janthinobacterium lividum]